MLIAKVDLMFMLAYRITKDKMKAISMPLYGFFGDEIYLKVVFSSLSPLETPQTNPLLWLTS